MAPKKTQLKSLSRKGVNKKKASVVKGGAPRSGPERPDKLAANHNQVVRTR